MTIRSWLGDFLGGGILHFFLPYDPPQWSKPWAAPAALLNVWPPFLEQSRDSPFSVIRNTLTWTKTPSSALTGKRGKKGLSLCLSCSGLGRFSLLMALDSRPDGDRVTGISGEHQASRCLLHAGRQLPGPPLTTQMEYKFYLIILQKNWKVCISNHCTQEIFFQT